MANHIDDLTSQTNGGTQTLPSPTMGTTSTQAAPSSPTRSPNGTGSGEESLIVEGKPGTGIEPTAGEGGAATNGSSVNLHDEVTREGAESSEEVLEASPEQLNTAPLPENNAISDLEGIEGFEAPEYGEPGDGSGSESQGLNDYLYEAGDELEGTEEFLPFLASLVPTLASSVGPLIGKAINSRLSKKSRRKLQRLPKRPRPAGPSRQPRPSINSILATVARLLSTIPQAQSTAFESGAESLVDEAFIEETVRVLEVIIGRDDRVRIPTTTNVPWRHMCALRITFPSGATYRGSGFFIGPRTVATAGHCVYLRSQGGWARQVEVIPGANGEAKPFGTAIATNFRSVSGWVSHQRPESDYGCIVLPEGSFKGGSTVGNIGLASFEASTLLAKTAVLAGYPGDKPFAEFWGMGCRIKRVTDKTLIYDIDTMGGQSGSPVYIKINNQRYVVGIHNYGSLSGNSATRITRPIFQLMKKWSQL